MQICQKKRELQIFLKEVIIKISLRNSERPQFDFNLTKVKNDKSKVWRAGGNMSAFNLGLKLENVGNT